jgi:hypothetical protein
MIELAQDIVVTAVAASAFVIVGRRVFGAVRPKAGAQAACPSCASGAAACAKPAAHQATAEVHSLTLIRAGSKPQA